jgi:hypothetical protein
MVYESVLQVIILNSQNIFMFFANIHMTHMTTFIHAHTDARPRHTQCRHIKTPPPPSHKNNPVGQTPNQDYHNTFLAKLFAEYRFRFQSPLIFPERVK